jgi:hypothetical protein
MVRTLSDKLICTSFSSRPGSSAVISISLSVSVTSVTGINLPPGGMLGVGNPRVKSSLEVGAIPEASTPEQYGKMIADDQKRWGDIVRKLALTAE